jgi:hypothetical protein
MYPIVQYCWYRGTWSLRRLCTWKAAGPFVMITFLDEIARSFFRILLLAGSSSMTHSQYLNSMNNTRRDFLQKMRTRIMVSKHQQPPDFSWQWCNEVMYTKCLCRHSCHDSRVFLLEWISWILMTPHSSEHSTKPLTTGMVSRFWFFSFDDGHQSFYSYSIDIEGKTCCPEWFSNCGTNFVF